MTARGRNSAPLPKPAVTPQPPGSGLKGWHHKKKVEKEAQVAELDKLREDAVTVVREGREFQLVTIPDRYWWGRLGSSTGGPSP